MTAPGGVGELLLSVARRFDAGQSVVRIASDLGVTRRYVSKCKRALQRVGRLPAAPPRVPWTPPDPSLTDREAALARGRALAAAKVASGEWVLPKETAR